MKQPCADRFRADDGGHSFAVQFRKHGVVDGHGEMEDATERLTGFTDYGKESGNVGARSGVGLHDVDLSAGIAQILDKGFGFRRGCAVAAGKDEMTRTGLDKPIGQHLAEPAECAGDQITSVRFNLELRDGLTAPGQKRLWERDDDFSDVLAAGHESKGRVDIERL